MVDCGPPDVSLDSIQPLAEDIVTTNGTEVTFMCRENFGVYMEGDRARSSYTIQCQENGTWTESGECGETFFPPSG